MSKNQEILLSNSAVDFLKEKIGEGGTTVVANPTLSGTEANLTGLQVGDTKYAVPQGGGGAGIEFVDIEGKSGEFTQQEYAKLQNGAIIRKNGKELYFYAGAGEFLYYTTIPHPNGNILVVNSIEIDMTTLEWAFNSYEIAVIQ